MVTILLPFLWNNKQKSNKAFQGFLKKIILKFTQNLKSSG